MVADALGAMRIPSACSSRQVPTVRRSCHPMPGASAWPLARSHTITEARWLAMPTPATGPPSANASVATLSTASAMRVASNSTRPGAGVSGRRWTWCSCATVASRPHDGGGGPPTCRRRRRGRCRSRVHAQGAGPERRGQAELARVEDPVRVERLLEAAQDLEAGAERAWGRNRLRLRPMPWWWLIAAPWASVASVTTSHASAVVARRATRRRSPGRGRRT